MKRLVRDGIGGKIMQDNQNIFVVSVDMENRSAEDIAKEAVQKIAEITDVLIEKYNHGFECKTD